jgi:hypothetical protein
MVVDYDAANKDTNFQKEGGMDAFNDYIDGLQDLIDTEKDNSTRLEDIEDEIIDLSETGLEEYSNLLTQVRDAIVNENQKAIDEMSLTNEAIQEVNTSIMDKIQEQIDEQRQARQNEQTEQNLLDKRARLMMLKSDTSGANAAQIAALEKELFNEE